MKRNHIIFAMAALSFAVSACENNRDNALPGATACFLAEGVLESAPFYVVDEDPAVTLRVFRSGYYAESLTVSVRSSESALETYNSENATAYKALPQSAYRIEPERITLAGDERSGAFQVIFDPMQLVGVEDPENLVVPVELLSDGNVSAKRNILLVHPNLEQIAVEIDEAATLFYITGENTYVNNAANAWDQTLTLKLARPFEADGTVALDCSQAALDAYNAKTGYDIPIHVDAASGGFILPFLKPELKWDFRLKWVLSISTSGHKFGLVYPGLGWVVWKDKSYLPDSMSFSVNYLGANITQVGLNFSRPAAQILGQYYQFIRLGFEGYKAVQENSMAVTQYLHDQIGKMAPFVNYSNEVVNPLFIWYLKPDYAKKAKWTLYDLQDKLKQSGWMVPAYTLPNNLENHVVMRIVARQGFSRDMADQLLNDITGAVAELEKLEYPTPTRIAQDKNQEVKGSVFTHTGMPHKKK